jgi:hypothetical protein
MANENKGILTDPADWATTDLTAILRAGEIGFDESTGGGTFYIIGDGTSTLTQLYSSPGIMGGSMDSTNFDARITALIGSSTKGIVDQKAGYRGSLATTPTAAWSAGTYLPGAVVANNDLYYYLSNSVSTTTEPAQETEWEVCPDIQNATKLTKSITTAGLGSLSDPKNSDFKNYYKIGEYSEGSNEFDLFRINVAGQVTSTSTTDFYKLVDASDIKAKFSTFVTDHYELEDYRGHAIVAGDASAGYRDANGTAQPHGMQRITGQVWGKAGVATPAEHGISNTGVEKDGVLMFGDTDFTAAITTAAVQSGYTSNEIKIDTAGQTGKTFNTSGDGDGNEGSDPGETYMNNVANGCGCVHVMIARGTITSISG